MRVFQKLVSALLVFAGFTFAVAALLCVLTSSDLTPMLILAALFGTPCVAGGLILWRRHKPPGPFGAFLLPLVVMLALLSAAAFWTVAKEQRLRFALLNDIVRRNTASALRVLEQGADPNVHDVAGVTILMLAAGSGQTAVVNALIARGANVEAADDKGFTPLLMAAAAGHTQTIEALLVKGARVERSRSDGHTPLMYAAVNGHVEAVRALLAHRADPNARTRTGITAMMLAAGRGHRDIADLLRRAGARD